MPSIGYERTLHANETILAAEQAIRQDLLALKKVMEDKPGKSGHPWAGKTVRFTGGPRMITTTSPDGKTVVTGTWDYKVVQHEP